MPTWPKDELLQHGPELPMAERVRRYQHNIRTIRSSGCAVPSSAYVDTLDPVAIEMWFLDSAERRHRLKAAVQALRLAAAGLRGRLSRRPFRPSLRRRGPGRRAALRPLAVGQTACGSNSRMM